MGSISYRVLCRVQFRHAYFLDRGGQSFEDMGEEERDLQLESFNWKGFWELRPSVLTTRKLARHRILIKHFSSSMVLLARNLPDEDQLPFAPLPPELCLCFFVYYKDPLFEQYTDIPFSEDSAFFLSNRLPEESHMGEATLLPINSEPLIQEEYIRSKPQIAEVLRDEGEVLPPGAKGVLLFYMQGESGDWNIANSNGTLKVNPTTFWLSFANRLTYWRYLRSRENLTLETLSPKPLTLNGFVEILPDEDFGEDQGPFEGWQFPNPSIKSIKMESGRLISEIHL